jgi:hypothetical protein
MRVASVLCLAILILPAVPIAAAEFGEEVNGYPVGQGGFLHDPAERFLPEALTALQEQFANDYPQLNRVGPATAYPYYPILEAEIQRLALDHPDKVKIQYGTSTGRLAIYFLEIANWGDEGSADFVPIEEREVVMIDGGTHSNEYSGVYFVLALAQWLLDGTPEDEFAQWVLENRYTIITPMVNPDGSHAMGRLNANAVNINRNYPVLWGGDGTDMLLNNPGPSAMSEVETKLVVDRVQHYQPDYHASIHCCGNLWLFPYGEDGYDPLDVDMMNYVCDVAFPIEIRDSCGPIWSTIYPASGSTVDTVYEYTGAVPFGFEMSGRSNLAGPWGEPVTFVEVQEQEAESWGAIMHVMENIHLYGGYPIIDTIDKIGNELEVTIHNAGYGNMTGNITLSLPLAAEATSTMTAMPRLMPNETATFRVALPADGQEYLFAMDYEKRVMMAPTGHIELPLTIANGAVTGGAISGATVGALGSEGLAGDVGRSLGTEATADSEAAGLGFLALIAAVAVAMFARRRA